MEQKSEMATRIKRIGTTPAPGYTKVSEDFHIYNAGGAVFFDKTVEGVHMKAHNYDVQRRRRKFAEQVREETISFNTNRRSTAAC